MRGLTYVAPLHERGGTLHGTILCMRVHVDTDFGGDPDDACAVAMLLGWPDVEIVGITTNLDPCHRFTGLRIDS